MFSSMHHSWKNPKLIFFCRYTNASVMKGYYLPISVICDWLIPFTDKWSVEHFGTWADERVQSPWLRLFYWFARHQMGHSHQPNHKDTPLSLPPCSSLQSLIDHLRYCMWPGTNAWNRTGHWSKRFFLASDIVCKHNLILSNCLLS